MHPRYVNNGSFSKYHRLPGMDQHLGTMNGVKITISAYNIFEGDLIKLFQRMETAVEDGSEIKLVSLCADKNKNDVLLVPWGFHQVVCLITMIMSYGCAMYGIIHLIRIYGFEMRCTKSQQAVAASLPSTRSWKKSTVSKEPDVKKSRSTVQIVCIIAEIIGSVIRGSSAIDLYGALGLLDVRNYTFSKI